ncbi:MAG TPA: hypothetical protein VF014_10495 [Casimicrobiaceae bacterium]|nr:hypothetical protein [Casimicrobiaceae bacterium]
MAAVGAFSFDVGIALPSLSRNTIGPYQNPSVAMAAGAPAIAPIHGPPMRVPHSKVQSEREREGSKRDQRYPRDEPIDARRCLPLLDDAVTGARCNEKADDEDHEAKNDKLYHLLDRKQVKKRILERRLKLKPEQDLGTQHQHAGFIKRHLRLVGERHFSFGLFASASNLSA